MLKPTIEYVPEYIKKTRERLEEFLRTIKKEANVHRRIASKLSMESNDENDKLDDTKVHDGQSAMADRLEVKFKVFFSEELKR